MTLRFVVLHHTMPSYSDRLSHWDIMIEEGEDLLTWALLDEPFSQVIQESQRLNNHRLEYLEYEGEISGGRGNVKRWDNGEINFLSSSADSYEFEMKGERLKARAKLKREDRDIWLIKWSTIDSVEN